MMVDLIYFNVLGVVIEYICDEIDLMLFLFVFGDVLVVMFVVVIVMLIMMDVVKVIVVK